MSERVTPLPTTEELLLTLEICRWALPSDAHPAHAERLAFLRDMIPWWRAQIRRSGAAPTAISERRQA